MNQQVATELLESAGAVVTVANHGGEAVKLLKEGPDSPRVRCRADGSANAGDGRHTRPRGCCAQTRVSRTCPIIAMTAHALVEERQRCLEAGMNDHVTKPIDPDALFATLKRWAKPRAQAAATPVDKAAAGHERCDLTRDRGHRCGRRTEAGRRELSVCTGACWSSSPRNRRMPGTDRGGAAQAGITNWPSRIAHTVKGVAGNLGIGAIQGAAEKIERGIREKDQAVSGLLPDFEAALGSMSKRIARALADTAPGRRSRARGNSMPKLRRRRWPGSGR